MLQGTLGTLERLMGILSNGRFQPIGGNTFCLTIFTEARVYNGLCLTNFIDTRILRNNSRGARNSS